MGRPCRPITLDDDRRYCGPDRRPVSGSRNSLLFPVSGPIGGNWNMLRMVPDFVSIEPLPMRPADQLSSIKRRIEPWLVKLWSTKFDLAKGEITSRG